MHKSARIYVRNYICATKSCNRNYTSEHKYQHTERLGTFAVTSAFERLLEDGHYRSFATVEFTRTLKRESEIRQRENSLKVDLLILQRGLMPLVDAQV